MKASTVKAKTASPAGIAKNSESTAKALEALEGEQAATEVDLEEAFLAGIAEALANLSPGKATDLRDKGYLGKHHVPALAREVQFVVSGY